MTSDNRSGGTLELADLRSCGRWCGGGIWLEVRSGGIDGWLQWLLLAGCVL